MSEIVQLVGEAAARGTALTLSVDELSPRRALEILAELGSSHRVTIQGAPGCITVELGNGLIVGAKAAVAGRELTGKEAYACIRHITEGEVNIEPLRFPSLANILEPVEHLLDLSLLSGPTPIGDDTVELALPEARPFHPAPMYEPPTMELELPPEAETVVELKPRRSAPPATDQVPPPHMPGLAKASPARPPVARSRRRRGALVLVSSAAALTLGLVGAAWSITSSSADAPIETIAPVTTASPTPVSARLTPVDMDFGDLEPSETDSDTPGEARRLARSARALLREGNAPAALAAARRAAQIRGGRPFYQVLLGDALRANGRRAAANRAYRRAVRLRPGYRPAVRRLQRRASRVGSSNPSRG